MSSQPPPQHDAPRAESSYRHAAPGTPAAQATGKTPGRSTKAKVRARTSIPMRVVRIETRPMTETEHRDAVQALAVLINRYMNTAPEPAAPE